jgi:hypothetical protein
MTVGVVVVVVVVVVVNLRHPERSVGSLSTYLKFPQSYLLLNQGWRSSNSSNNKFTSSSAAWEL